ncbi:MAG: hypothetical protein HW380_3296 [Magnetococcales bacterium]|nr:hypothetical protein [Magnetococcales bacterium]
MKSKLKILAACLASAGGLMAGDAWAHLCPDGVTGSALVKEILHDCPSSAYSYGSASENTETRTETTQQVRIVSSHLVNILRPSAFRVKAGKDKVSFNEGGNIFSQRLASNGQEGFEGMTGLSAGGGTFNNGVWGKYNIVDTTDRTSGLTIDTVSMETAIGYDRLFKNKIIVGLTPIFGRSEQKVEFNATDKSAVSSISLNPYAAYKFNDMFSLYTLAGYTWADGDRLVSDYEKSMITIGALGFFPVDNLQLTGNIGFWASTTNPDDSTDETVLNQFNASLEAAYPIETARGGVVEPYAGVGLEIDTNFERAAGYDPNGGVLSLGTRIAFNEAWSGDVKFSDGIQRGSVRERGLELQLNLRF